MDLQLSLVPLGTSPVVAGDLQPQPESQTLALGPLRGGLVVGTAHPTVVAPLRGAGTWGNFDPGVASLRS